MVVNEEITYSVVLREGNSNVGHYTYLGEEKVGEGGGGFAVFGLN